MEESAQGKKKRGGTVKKIDGPLPLQLSTESWLTLIFLPSNLQSPNPYLGSYHITRCRKEGQNAFFLSY